MKMAKVKIFLMTHDRPEFVQKAVDSILAQNYDDFELIISDNSTNNKTLELLKDFRHPKFSYIKRELAGVWEHTWDYIFNEVKSPYFMMFHDDDELHPDYLKEVMAVFDKNPDTAAVGVNAFIIRGNTYTKDTVFNISDEIIFISDKNKFIASHITPTPVPPYPWYTFNSKIISAVQSVKHYGGKYADSLLLMETLQVGKIAWIMKPLMSYRVHKNQGSAQPKLTDSLSLLRYVYKRTSLTRHSPEIMYYRRVIWCDWLKFSFKIAFKKHPKIYFKVLCYLFPYLLKNKLSQLEKIIQKVLIFKKK